MSEVQLNMMHQIGLNHIFDDGTICFCLVCKDSITENYPLDRDKAICEHFRSEGHEESARNLFKICIPDPKCESRNVKYLDIVNNSELEVWEQGNKPSYVSKNENHFVCLICQEEVSKVCGDTKKIKHNLQDHLGSELHTDNVRSSFWWIYHPHLDNNYIALCKIFMFCSFCQQILESDKNSLLEFAADHIETEQKKTYSDKTSKTKLGAINSDNALKTQLEVTDSDDVTKFKWTNIDSPVKTEFEDTNSVQILNTQFESDLKLYKPGPIFENTQTTTTHLNELSTSLVSGLDNDSNVKFAGSETNLNEVSDGVKSAGKSFDLEGLDSFHVSDNFSLDAFSEEVVVCPKCQEEVEVLNNDVPFSMQKHSQKHKDLSFIRNDIELEIQGKDNCVCKLCHKQIEIFNKDTVLSYNVHIEDCYSNNKSPLVSIEHANSNCAADQEYLEESDTIAKAFSLLPVGLKDQINFIRIVGGNLKCILCNFELSSSNDITVVCHVLQNHFSEFYHKSQYKACVEKDLDHVKDEQEFEENNHLFKGLQFDRSTPNEMRNQGIFGKSIALEQYNTNESTLAVDGGKVRTRFEVLEILYRLVHKHPLLEENLPMLDEKEGHFHCNLCEETLRCTRSGAELLKHLKGESHSIKLSKNQIDLRIEGKVRKRAEVLNILKELSRCNKVINQNIEDIGEKNGHFFCKRCGEIIMCTRSGRKLVDHLNGLNHGCQTERCEEEQRELRLKARPSQQVYNILWQLASSISEVNENIEILKEKQGHFYCEICDEILLCTCCGSKLIVHLRSKKHVFNLINYTKNNLI